MLKLAGWKTQLLPRRDRLLPGSEPPRHAHTTRCRSATTLLGLVVQRLTAALHATAGRPAGRAPGLPTSPQVTCTAQGRREKLTRCRGERCGAASTPQSTRQLRRRLLSVPEPAVPRAPCEPHAGTAALSPTQPLGSLGRVAPWAVELAAHPRVAGQTLKSVLQRCAPPAPAPARPQAPCPGTAGMHSGVTWSPPVLQTVRTLSLPASKAEWQFLSAAPSSCTTTARKAPSPCSSLPPAQRAAAQAGPAAVACQGPPTLSSTTHSCAQGLRGPWEHRPTLPRGPGWSMAGRQPPLPALPGALAHTPPGSGERLGASASTSPRVGGLHPPCLLQLSPSPRHQQDLPRGSL